MTMNESIDLNVARVKALWMNGTTRVFVIPANAGSSIGVTPDACGPQTRRHDWIAAFAGMTIRRGNDVVSPLKFVERRQSEQRCQLVERAPRFVEQRGIGEVGWHEPVSVAAHDDRLERVGERVVDEHPA